MSKPNALCWVKTHSCNDIEVYELFNHENKLMSLSFDNFSHTAKVECFTSRRIFKIEKEGFLRTKTIFKNEYGIKIGALEEEQWFHKEGLIELNEEKFHYKTQNNPLAELIIYKESPQNPILTCDLQYTNNEAAVNVHKHHSKHNYSIFLIALAWFLFLPIAKEYIPKLSPFLFTK